VTRDIGGDVRLAVRSLRAAPAMTLAASLTLALGLGATTAIFSVANGLLLRPLPVTDPQRLVTITSDLALRYGFQAGAGWSYAMWDRFRQRADVFDGAFAWTLQRVDLSDAGEMQPANVLIASAGVFETLGVRAIVGRTFTSADDVPGGGPDGAVAVISHDLWRDRFNGATDIIGSRLSLEGTPLAIVGVTPAGFRGVDIGRPFDVAIPFGSEALVRGRRSLRESERALLLTVMLRLKSGQTITDATAAVRAMQPQILGNMPPQFQKDPFLVVAAATGISDRSQLRQRYERPLVILAIVSGLVLVIVCVNIANMFLARASARRHELSVRLAVGAPRWRLMRQLFVEGLALGSAGVIAGVIFAVWAGRALVAALPAPDGPFLVDLPIDWRVLAFAVGVGMTAVVLFGTMPAAYAAGVPPLEALQGRGSNGGRAARLASGLIVPQVALSLVLLAAAGLFVRTLDRLVNVPLGFDPGDVLVVTVNTGRTSIADASRMPLYERILDATRAVPGITASAASIWTPVGTSGGGLLADARGRRAELGRQLAFNFVTPGWFTTYRTPIREGRDFDSRDRSGAAPVAVVNETLARRLFGDRPAVGEVIDAGPCGRRGCTVVGIAGDTVYGSLRDAPPPTVFVPLAQATDLPPNPQLRVSVRAAGDSARLVPELASALRGVDSRLAYSFRRLDLDVAAAVAQERLVARLAEFLGAIAVLLSGIGLYGVISYIVTRRRAEIGIRLALGGQPAAVIGLILMRVGVLVIAGTASGLLAALWLSRFVAPLLYGLGPRDPATLAMATGTLAAVAALAGWIPASRAMRTDPAHVLREH
jgi:predicted permease